MNYKETLQAIDPVKAFKVLDIQSTQEGAVSILSVYNLRTAGCIAFTVYHEEKKIAFFGIRIKDRKRIFHKSFNPELYLYNYDRIYPEEDVYFTEDIFECVRLIQKGVPAVCNFGLPYLSSSHLDMLQKCKYVSVMCENGNMDEMKKQFFESFSNYVRFIKPTQSLLI